MTAKTKGSGTLKAQVWRVAESELERTPGGLRYTENFERCRQQRDVPTILRHPVPEFSVQAPPSAAAVAAG